VRPPEDKSIRRWYKQFRETRGVNSIGRPRTTDEDVDLVRQAFIRSPKKSICRARADAAIDCPHNSSVEPASKTIQLPVDYRWDVCRATDVAHCEVFRI
jgi:hypothetical protein